MILALLVSFFIIVAIIIFSLITDSTREIKEEWLTKQINDEMIECCRKIINDGMEIECLGNYVSHSSPHYFDGYVMQHMYDFTCKTALFNLQYTFDINSKEVTIITCMLKTVTSEKPYLLYFGSSPDTEEQYVGPDVPVEIHELLREKSYEGHLIYKLMH
jgi:hypothetical protein